MLTIMMWKVILKAIKQKYFIEMIVLFLMLLTGLIGFIQYVHMEAFRIQEDTATTKFHDLDNLHPYTSNNKWQRVKGTSQELHVYSAYYDDRENKKLIRIIGLSEPYFKDAIQCELFFENSETEQIFVSASVEAIVKDMEAELVAGFVTCSLPEGTEIPRAVTVTVGREPMISNLLLVQRFLPRTLYQSKNMPMVACVEPLDKDYSQVIRLLEFIELNRILGVDHFIFYQQSVSENVSCVFSDYVKQGRITVIDWNIPNQESGPESEVQHEGGLAALNDCLYQTMFKYQYATFLSIDEFIVPKQAKTLKDLIRNKENSRYHKNTGALVFKVANFYLEWPDEMWGGRNYLSFYLMTVYKIKQTINDIKKSTKSVCNPKAVLQVGAHSELQLAPGYHAMDVEELQGLCHRYRQTANGQPLPPEGQALHDSSAVRFAPKLMRALVKQWQISMPHCSLNDAKDVRIQHFGSRNTPILMDNLLAR